jgi:hypothetical protein
MQIPVHTGIEMLGVKRFSRLIRPYLLGAVIALTACGHPAAARLGSAAVAHSNVSAAESAGAQSSSDGSSSLNALSTLQPQAVVGTPLRSLPGNDPGIQKWFRQIDAVKIAFDAALFSAEKGIAAGRAADCQSLARQSTALLNLLPTLQRLPTPGAADLAGALQPMLTTMSELARVCAAGDFAAARSMLGTAVSQQAEAQGRVDEILDGDG